MLLLRLVVVTCVALAVQTAAQADDAPSVPNEAPLTAAEIKELIDGRGFAFVAYDQPLTGTSEWSFDKGVVSGSFVWGETEKGTYGVEMYIENDQLCTVQGETGVICQIVYGYEDGFMEVTPEGVVHAVSKPLD